MFKNLLAEAVGTFWLVFGGCGSAVLASGVQDLGIGYVGVSLAFGLTVLSMAYAVAHVSGAHFNPAVTIGLATAKRFEWRDVPGYVVTQVVAAALAATALFVVANGKPGFTVPDWGFATNGYGDRSPGEYSLLAVLVAEVLLTAFFLYVILGVTDPRAPEGFGPLAIGLALTLIHLVSIPVSNTSVNPARSTGPALFAGGEALGQLWLFWLAPVLGAALAGASYAVLVGVRERAPHAAVSAAGEPTAG